MERSKILCSRVLLQISVTSVVCLVVLSRLELADNNLLSEACDHAAASRETSGSFSRGFGVHLSYYMAWDQSTGCGSIRSDVT